jgi:hypothetical protein
MGSLDKIPISLGRYGVGVLSPRISAEVFDVVANDEYNSIYMDGSGVGL